ncbi:cilia- and flagella-associated protein 74 isoform X12 [Oxyura jamaicensis]|uniref:cilia- and flagella-associated protein 74 isoform X12 n=1 Tax=Oxyura jamaicensis TaxID=8884 RepID=UPI0015A6DBF7|nr:cilia- and flagella-associated protein 74 isoform X12 [Oxyura jamaicensis]
MCRYLKDVLGDTLIPEKTENSNVEHPPPSRTQPLPGPNSLRRRSSQLPPPARSPPRHAPLREPGCCKRTMNIEDRKFSDSNEEEQETLLPFLEEEEKEDQAGQCSDMKECWREHQLDEELVDGGKMGNKVTSEGAGDKSESSIDELTTCQLRIKMLEKQLDYVDIEIQKEKEADNVAAMFRLQAAHRRLCTELEDEKDFELKIALTLKENMLEMWRIETEQGKYEVLHKQLQKDEEELESQYQEKAEARIRKEKIAALQAEENQLSRKKKEEEVQKEHEERHKKMLEEAKKNHEKAVCFLRKSMARIHEENAKEEVKTQEHMERRIQAVLSLKNSITSNREKLKALQAWNKAMAFEAKKEELKMREAILAEGGNVAKEIFLHKRLLQHEREKQAFREQQKSRKIEIVSRILQEKASICKQKNRQSCTKASKSGGKRKDSLLWRRKTWHYIEKTCEHPAGAISQLRCSPAEEQADGEKTAFVGDDVLCESVEDEKEKDKILAEPEFPGLWSQECDWHKVSNKDMDTKQLALSVMKKEISEKKMEEFQTTVSHKQIVSGHEPKGRTFYSKPSYIHFKDFDVGKIYKKKIVLTNASYSVNFCRLVGISEWLKDFISIQFEPPGKMSPGMSCEVGVTFKPAIDENLEGEVMFMAQTGSFSVPLKCTAKTCILCFSAIGVSIDVPVWVPNPNIDLKICMYDQLYQDCVVIQSRAKAPLRLKFEVCKELSKHMELLPKTGYIQAQSSFTVQLKFLPRHSLPQDAGSYFNEETSVLEVPVTILIADKTKQVNFTVHAIVTTYELEINPAEIDFGYCTIYEAVQTNVTLTNKSILPQEFGFVGLPEFVEIQPNDGFGVLLPLESLTLDIIFKANKAKEYSFELTCKSESNRRFKLSCRAVGVHPPLELSHSLVQFAATALNDVSTATLYVMNSHVSVNHFTHAVPRIGNGEVAPVGPTSFEFHVPEDCPVTVTPSVGTVLPGKKSLIQVSFRPTLSDQLIREEAARRLCRAAATGAEIQKKKKDEKRDGKKSNIPITRQQSSGQFVKDGSSKYLSSSSSSEQPESKEIKPDSEAYMAARAFLMRNFRGRFEKYIIPCFIASGDIDEKRGSENLTCSPYNTLYLELHCPAVAPSVVVTSDHGKNTVSFGDVAVGHTIIKQVTIQNISPEKLELGFSVLNPSGPFLLVRAVRILEPGENKALIISFSPNENKWFFEALDIRTAQKNLTLSITGRGVMPSIVCSVEEVLDMGYVLAREKTTFTFKIQNTSTLTLQYSIQLDSLSPTRSKDQQRLPSFLTSSLQRTEIVGTQNYSGLSVFSIFPTQGEIVAGKSQDFVVTFSPDHESLYYSDRLKVVLFGKKIAHVIQLKGAAREHPMFVEGGIPLDVPIESLAVTLPVSSQEALKEEPQEPVKSILLVLEHIEGENSLLPAKTELRVGAIQTAQFASKKNVEFSFDNLSLLQKKGFTVEFVKGTIDRGQVKCISVSWVPPADLDTTDPVIETALLTLKGDVKESYRILCMAKVVSACAPSN